MGKKQMHTKKEVSKILKKTGWLPASEIEQHPGLPSLSTIYKLFKTTKINDVWGKLGISLLPSYTKEEVSKALKKTDWLTASEIEQHIGLPSLSTIYKLFKTTKLSDVWKELNIPFTPQPSYTKEEVSKTLKKIGYLSQTKIAQHPDLPAYSTIRRLFKTTKMTDVWKELNIPFTPQPSFTKEEFVKILKEIGYL